MWPVKEGPPKRTLPFFFFFVFFSFFFVLLLFFFFFVFFLFFFRPERGLKAQLVSERTVEFAPAVGLATGHPGLRERFVDKLALTL